MTEVQNAMRFEFRPDYCVCDVGDMATYFELCQSGENMRRGILYTFGGLIGEIILVYTTIQDFIWANPGL